MCFRVGPIRTADHHDGLLEVYPRAPRGRSSRSNGWWITSAASALAGWADSFLLEPSAFLLEPSARGDGGDYGTEYLDTPPVWSRDGSMYCILYCTTSPNAVHVPPALCGQPVRSAGVHPTLGAHRQCIVSVPRFNPPCLASPVRPVPRPPSPVPRSRLLFGRLG